jgi:hypothetical protein
MHVHFSSHNRRSGKNFPDQLDDMRDDLMGLSDARRIQQNFLSYVNDSEQTTGQMGRQKLMVQGSTWHVVVRSYCDRKRKKKLISVQLSWR